MDFTNLNQLFLKDCFPLLKIDHEYLNSLNAYTKYYQIPIAQKDEEKKAFTIDKRTDCYKVMPLGVKNTRAIYLRMVTKVFKGLIRRNIKAYMNDKLV